MSTATTFGPLALVRSGVIPASAWQNRPAAKLGNLIDAVISAQATRDDALSALFADIQDQPIRVRARLSKVLQSCGAADALALDELPPEQRDAARRCAALCAELTEMRADIDRAANAALSDWPEWLRQLPAPFADGVNNSQSRLAQRLANPTFPGTLNKKTRRDIMGLVRLAQRAFYRTTPFPGLAGVAVCSRNGKQSPSLIHNAAPTEPMVALNSSFVTGRRPCSYYRMGAGGGVENVTLPAPDPVFAAVEALALTHCARPLSVFPAEATDTIAALRDMRVVTVTDPVSAPEPSTPIRVSTARTEAAFASGKAALSPIVPQLRALMGWSERNALRIWAADMFKGRVCNLQHVFEQIEMAPPPPMAHARPPALTRKMLSASGMNVDTFEIDMANLIPPNTKEGAGMIAVRFMRAADQTIVLNGVISGGLRQIARHVPAGNVPSYENAKSWVLGDEKSVRPLLLRPYMGKAFQDVAPFGSDVLSLPNEPLRITDNAVGLDDVQLDWTGHEPRFCNATGTQDWHPYYLGCIREPSLHLALRVILALSKTPLCEVNDRLLQSHTLADQYCLNVKLALPRRRPRLTMGKLILQRQRWAFVPTDVPAMRQDEKTGAFLVRFAKWRRDNALPQRLSVRQLTKGVPSYGQIPSVYLDTADPLSLADWRQAVRAASADWIIFEECLPDPAIPTDDHCEYLIEVAV